jgi:phosphoglycolate phosphatase
MSQTAGAPFRAVIFDLDGTLVDSAPDIREALNAGVALLGGRTLGLDEVHGMIGGGSRLAVQRALAAIGKPSVDEETNERVFAEFMRTYRRVTAYGRGLYPGAADLLAELRGEGMRLGLCTNKPEEVTDIAVRALEIHDYFDVVVGASDAVPKKPDPAMLMTVLQRLDVGIRDAVMIGDSAADVGVARAAGMPVVVLRHGYSKGPPEALGADIVIDSLAGVRGALTRLVGT